MRVPSNIVEGRSSPFPAGTFYGALGEVKDRWVQDRETKQNIRMVFDVTLKDITPIEGPNVGNRPCRQSFTIINGEQSLVDIVEFDDSVNFGLRQSAGLLAQLATALGAARADIEGNVTLDMEAFLEDLKNGNYAGAQLLFEVTHRTWKPKDAPKDAPARVSSEISRFAGTEAVGAVEVADANTARTRA